MIKYLTSMALMLFAFNGYSQICKIVKPGMSAAEVLKIAGLPDSTTMLGVDKVKDTLAIWHYGTQDAIFSKGKVDRVVIDPKRESELSKQLNDGTLKQDDFEKQMEELNQNSCK